MTLNNTLNFWFKGCDVLVLDCRCANPGLVAWGAPRYRAAGAREEDVRAALVREEAQAPGGARGGEHHHVRLRALQRIHLDPQPFFPRKPLY